MAEENTQDSTAQTSSDSAGSEQQPDQHNSSTASAYSAKPQTGKQDTSGQRDAAAEKPEKSADEKPSGDTSKLEKTLHKEREDRKAAEQALKEMQGKVDAAEKRTQDQLDALGTALGFKKDEAPPDPEALQRVIAEKNSRITEVERDRDQQVESLAGRARDAERLLAVMYQAADPNLGANLRALWDSKQFERSVAGLDHESDSFAKDATAVVKAALEANPTYRSSQTASAAEAGIGATGSNQSAAAAAKPGRGRMEAAYHTQ